MPHLTDFFLGLGWPWVGDFDGFIIIFVLFPTQQKLVNRKTPYCAGSVYIARIHPRKCPTVVDLADDMAPTRQRVLDETDQGSLCSERSRS